MSAFAVYCGLVFCIVLIMLGASHLLGERHRAPATGEPYESGMMPTGSARVRMSAEYYLIALFFVIFDVELAFLFPWALVARELGWSGFFAVLVFAGVLLAALFYLWRTGALDVGAAR
jgi:NADH-quinone oxidoreductase subunit A